MLSARIVTDPGHRIRSLLGYIGYLEAHLVVTLER